MKAKTTETTETTGSRMLVCTAKLKSVAPIAFSRPVQSEKNTGESHDAFEKRTWRERLHVNSEGRAFIPPMALKNALSEVAKYLGETVPGQGKATYTKHFEAGVMVIDPIDLGVSAEDVKGQTMFVPASGRRGDGKRVWKTFPVIPEWTGGVTIYVMDPLLIDKPDVIERYLSHAGKFIGMGSFRPRNNGFFGRFDVVEFKSNVE